MRLHTVAARPNQNLRYLGWMVLLCLVAACVVPQLWYQPSGADRSLEIVSRLQSLRTAIDGYWVQHGGVYPGEEGAEQLVQQLLGKSDLQGHVGVGPRFVYGPYVRAASIPDNPNAYLNGIRVVPAMPGVPTGREAWIYCPHTGDIRANSTGVDGSGTRFFDL